MKLEIILHQEQVANIINKYTPLDLTCQDVLFRKNFIQITKKSFQKYLDCLYVKNSKVPDTNFPFYHYKSFQYGKGILNSSTFTFSALANYKEPLQDIKEYEHFYELIKMKPAEGFIENQKSDIFITCLTYEKNNAKFWEDYADHNKGICIEFSIINNRSESISVPFDFREVCYDDSSKIASIAKMQSEIFLIFKKYLFMESHSRFSAFYKRDNFSWENEIRAYINLANIKNMLPENFKLRKLPHNIEILQVPFDNFLFKAEILSVKLGSALTIPQRKDIISLVKTKYPNVLIT